MDIIKDLLKKYIMYIGIFVVIILLICGIIYTNITNKKYKNKEKAIIVEKQETVKEDTVIIKADVKGQVINPGVYEIEENARVIDLINKAGGITESANTNYINLSKKLKDEMVVIIYSNDEINEYKSTNKIEKYIEEEIDKGCPDAVNNACIEEKGKDIEEENSSEDKKIININTASKEEFMTLTGIGESKAIAIINYRKDNGQFKTIENLKDVSGIGNNMYEKIKDSITV